MDEQQTQLPSRRSLRRPAVLVWMHLARIADRNWRAANEHLRSWELNTAQFDVLAQIGAAEGLTQQELAERLFVTQGNVTQLVDKLEGRGLLRRCPEGRTNRLVLTDAGRKLWTEVVPSQEDWQVAQFDSLSTIEQQQLLKLLQKLDRAQRQS